MIRCCETRWILLATCAASVFAVGCQRHRVHVTQEGHPEYEQVEMVYDLHSTRLVQQGSEIQQASGQTAGNQDFDGKWPFARLRVEYPHPNNRAGYARATLRLGRTPIIADPPSWTQKVRSGFQRMVKSEPPVDPSAPQLDDEIWALDVPRDELDGLLFDLTRRGFFEEQSRPTGDAELSVRIDRGSSSKRWTSEPKLDELIHRIYEDGWLAGYIDCESSGILQTGWSL